ncbi:protease complex subunit PrcB family protein [Noviherbaspirillum massiliense]|uniref:protease complex subunit PrcB family protein n=1 Tax=Noviherbaspirillum massiliense TaxID=1465823 RepID=UPI0002D6471D|nr:protease complex subunit PrcB family protein [Noviherbaspirillum massiliense]
MPKTWHVVGYLSLVCLSGCGGSPDDAQSSQSYAQASITKSATEEIAFQTVDANLYSGITGPETHVVRDANSWETLWLEHKKNEVPPSPHPLIDFSRETILAVFLGVRQTGCYDVKIRRIYAEDETVFVEYEEIRPGPGAICTQALSAPAHIVAIPRTDQPTIRFMRSG